jgi:hypothetical protein
LNIDFETTAQRIEANPLGRLMYGQRELFHSNLLAWFFDVLPDLADEVFKPLARPGSCAGRAVERERNHLDLVLRWPDRAPLVIENKVFSLPQWDQLEEYKGLTATWEPSPALLLLSVSEPDFDLGDWVHLSYEDLSRRILAVLPANETYEAETMRRYADLAGDLHRLVAAVDARSDRERVWLPEALLDAISSSQMRAALQKARAQRVARVINQHVHGLETPAKGDMSNATPFVESLEYARTGGMDVHLGWQLQGAQFRRAVVYRDEAVKGGSPSRRERRKGLSREHPEFFRFPHGLPQAMAGRKEFNHFAPSFVYRYVKVPDLTVGELKAIAVEVHGEVEALRHHSVPG